MVAAKLCLLKALMDVLRKLRHEHAISADDVVALLRAFGVRESDCVRLPVHGITLDALLRAHVAYSAGDVRRLLAALGLDGPTVSRAAFLRGVEVAASARVPVGGEAVFFGDADVVPANDLVARIVRVLNG